VVWEDSAEVSLRTGHLDAFPFDAAGDCLSLDRFGRPDGQGFPGLSLDFSLEFGVPG
jgi:hypothetical protein